MTIRAFESFKPLIGQRCFVDEQASVIGRVVIGEDSSIWPNTVVRGDVNKIRIGKRTNIQDNSTVHVTHDSEFSPGGYACSIGDEVTIGHQVIAHGCRIGHRCLIGMGSVIMDNTEIGNCTIIGAGSLITEGKILEGGYLWMGRPARRVRALTEEEIEHLSYSANHYVKLKDRYLANQS